MRRLLLVAPLVAAAGCVPTETTTTTTIPATDPPVGGGSSGVEIVASETDGVIRPRRSPADPCGAQSLQNLVGQPETVFFRMTFPDGTRYIGPGDAVTQDNQPRRINFDIDRGGVISRVWCG